MLPERERMNMGCRLNRQNPDRGFAGAPQPEDCTTCQGPRVRGNREEGRLVDEPGIVAQGGEGCEQPVSSTRVRSGREDEDTRSGWGNALRLFSGVVPISHPHQRTYFGPPARDHRDDA